ncbi:MAG: hypothetical protein GXY83_28845 [Rhodopirellula sp.]|nr:hypothetical protein [Rhodopirellula sp.]
MIGQGHVQLAEGDRLGQVEQVLGNAAGIHRVDQAAGARVGLRIAGRLAVDASEVFTVSRCQDLGTLPQFVESEPAPQLDSQATL